MSMSSSASTMKQRPRSITSHDSSSTQLGTKRPVKDPSLACIPQAEASPGCPEEVEPEDPYSGLRFQEEPEEEDEAKEVQLPCRSVLVKRPVKVKFSLAPLKQLPVIPHGLKLPEHSLTVETMGVYPEINHIPSKTNEFLTRLKDKCVSETLYRDRVVNAQGKSIQNWEHWKNALHEQGTRLCNRVGRSRNSLILNKSTRLPPIQHEIGQYKHGPERFYQSDAFFKIAERPCHDQRLVTSLTWTERKLHSPSYAIIPTGAGLSQQAPSSGWAGAKTPVGSLPGLFLHGHGLDTDTTRNTSDAGDCCKVQEEDVTLPEPLPLPNPPTPSLPVYKKPCLQVGDQVYSWMEPCLQTMNEIGITSYAGVAAKTTLTLTNLGCTVLRYRWSRDNHVDHFGTGRYRVSPFFFDSAEHILLPKDSVSLALQFFADMPGRWCEHWRLCTTPQLGPEDGQGICINLWGMSLARDRNRDARKQLDKHLEDLATRTMIARFVNDLVNFLPICCTKETREDATKTLERALSADDVRQFEERNPGLIYNSAAICTLLRLVKHAVILNNYARRRRRESKMTWNVVRAVLLMKIHMDYLSAQPPGVDYFHVPRAKLDVRQIRQRMLTVDERYGDVMCKQLNESVSAMTFRVREAQQAPLYLVCRTAVARAFDHISLAELRLRRNLQLAHNELLKQRSTFCSVNSCSPSPSDSSDSSLEHYVLDVISECSVEETLDETLSSVEAPVQFRLMEQYRDKLYGKVYEILCDLVESLQPVMTHEGVDLNPFHRPVADRE